MAELTVQIADRLLRRTLEVAEAHHSTVDDVVAQALQGLHPSPSQPASEETLAVRRERFDAILQKYSGFDTGGPFTRNEMNER